MTVPEAAEILGIGKNTAYQAAKRGEIPTIRIGGRVLVPVAKFEDLLNGNDTGVSGAVPTHDHE